jgi:uncharacterized protein YceH (UPF0502 family)
MERFEDCAEIARKFEFLGGKSEIETCSVLQLEREQGKRPRRHRLLVHTLDLPAHVEPLTLIMSTIFVIAMD